MPNSTLCVGGLTLCTAYIPLLPPKKVFETVVLFKLLLAVLLSYMDSESNHCKQRFFFPLKSGGDPFSVSHSDYVFVLSQMFFMMNRKKGV